MFRIWSKPVFEEKELAIGNRVKHWILGEGTIMDMYEFDKKLKEEMYEIEFDIKENNVDDIFHSNQLQLIK